MQHADFLLADMLSAINDGPADVVIGNPPYIRYDDLADELRAVPQDLADDARAR